MCIIEKKKLELTRGSHDFDIASYQKGDSKYVKRNFIRKKKETMTWLLEYRLERKAHAHLYKA